MKKEVRTSTLIDSYRFPIKLGMTLVTLFFISFPLISSAQIAKDWAGPNCEDIMDNTGLLDSEQGHVGCRCGHTIEKDLGGGTMRPLVVKCYPLENVCSTNEFNYYGYKVCLSKVGKFCKNDSDCEGGTFCKDSKCTLNTGDETLGGVIGQTTRDLFPTLRGALNIITGLLGAILVFFLLYGVAHWLTAAGNEEKVQKGKHIVAWAAIGAIIISIAWTITTYILRLGVIAGG